MGLHAPRFLVASAAVSLFDRGMTLPDFTFEEAARSRGSTCIAGVDEVGRGPLAGPVVAAAVVLDPARLPEGLNDSKKLTAKRREAICTAIWDMAQVGVGQASVEEIVEVCLDDRF